MKKTLLRFKCLVAALALLAIALPSRGAHLIDGFHPDVSHEIPDITNVNTIAIAPDGKIVIGGHFRIIDGVPRHGVARLNVDGSVDDSFNQALYPNGWQGFILTHYLVVQPDGKIVSSGLVLTNGAYGIGRLNPDGSLDSSFQFRPAVGIAGMALQSDGKVLVWGWNGVFGSRRLLGRLLADGTQDYFAATDLEWILGVAVQPDDKVLVTGDFSSGNSQPIRALRRFNHDGTTDSTFNPGNLTTWPVLVVPTDGKILASGFHADHNLRGVIRLRPDGSLDTTFHVFDPGVGNSARLLSLQEDGKILVLLMNYLAYPNVSRMARLNSDGTLDESFNGPEVDPETTVVQADGRILIGGTFTEISGQPRHRIARLNVDGSLETTQMAYTIRVNSSPEGGGTTAGGGTFAMSTLQTVTASPRRSLAFANWTENGNVVSASASYAFIVDRDRELTANFISQPFIPTKGDYNGLFYETNGVAPQSSGFIRITTTAASHFSGRLQFGGWRQGFSGQFDSNGIADLTLARPDGQSLTLHLEVDLTPDSNLISGTLSDGFWTSELLAHRAMFDTRTNAAPQAGYYTMAVRATRSSSSEVVVAPIGYGYATALVSKSGTARLVGTLADGTKISQAARLSQDGQWPLYLSVYGGRGSVLGWISFSNSTLFDLTGRLVWSKPEIANAEASSGFVTRAGTWGARYFTPSAGERVIDVIDGQVKLTDQNSAPIIANRFAITTDNRVVNLSGNQLDLRLNLATGMFRGRIVDPTTDLSVPFQGVLLQKQNKGVGYFLESKNAGSVVLEAFR